MLSGGVVLGNCLLIRCCVAAVCYLAWWLLTLLLCGLTLVVRCLRDDLCVGLEQLCDLGFTSVCFFVWFAYVVMFCGWVGWCLDWRLRVVGYWLFGLRVMVGGRCGFVLIVLYISVF